jgi:predicted PurR-regulated permease PerM
MNKRVFVFLIVAVFILPILLQLASAQIGVDLSNPAQVPGQIQETQQQLEKLKNQTEWQYLGIRIQESLMKNSFIAWMDSSFKSISIVFNILFGMPYSLSITLLFVIALWLIVFIDGGNIIHSHSALSSGASYGISFAFALVFSQLKVFENIVNFAGTLVFAREAWWARMLLVFVIILVLIVLDQGGRYLAKYLKKKKEAKEKAESTAAGREIQATAKGLREGEKFIK